MDWTIIVSVLVALILWVLVLASAAAVMMLGMAMFFRGRMLRMMDGSMEGMMSRCMVHFRRQMDHSRSQETESVNPERLGV